MRTGIVTSSMGAWYRVRMDDGSTVSARLKGKFRLKGKELTNPIAVGDLVEVDVRGGDDSVIDHIHDRENYLIRQSAKQSSRYHIVASNIDLAIIIITQNNPRTSDGFVDRFLTTCEAYSISALLLFNKTDLITSEMRKELDNRMRVYREIGYSVFESSLTTSGVPNELKMSIQNKRVLLFGHSGVGKSTLINLLAPHAGQEVNEISEALGKGKHTTTYARMIWCEAENADIIDTPGIREFGLEPMENWKLAHYFPEFRELLPNCKFNNCIHIKEPGCAILSALNEGKVAEFRYKSYLNIINTMPTNEFE